MEKVPFLNNNNHVPSHLKLPNCLKTIIRILVGSSDNPSWKQFHQSHKKRSSDTSSQLSISEHFDKVQNWNL